MPYPEIIKTALMRRKQVEAQTGLARSTLYKMMASGDFPASVHITGKAVAWASSDVDNWIATRIAASKTA